MKVRSMNRLKPLFFFSGLLSIALLIAGYTSHFDIQKKGGRDTTVTKEYTITGYGHGFADGTWLYFDEADNLGKALDSAMLIDERFTFTVKKIVSADPEQFAIRTKSFSDYKLFWMENSSIIISGIKGNFRSAMIEGSGFQRQLESFDRLTMPLILVIDSLRRNFGTTDTVIFKNILRLEEELKNKSIHFVATNSASVAAAYLLCVYGRQWGRNVAAELYNQLTAVPRQSAFGQKIKKFIDLNKELKTGDTYIDFTLPSPEGLTIKLSSIKNKYILLEFWASWCGPCRRENPNLAVLYEKYKRRGFEIFGVSNDASAADWKKAIAKDKLQWTNVSALQGGDYDVALIYGIYEIPTNFLIDPSGKIIAKNLRGEELSNKLKELFGD